MAQAKALEAAGCELIRAAVPDRESLPLISPADVAGIDADFVHASLRRPQGQPVVKMNVRHDWGGAEFLGAS